MTNYKKPPKKKAHSKPKPKKRPPVKAKKRPPRVMKDNKGYYFTDPKGKKFRVEGSANYHLGPIQRAVFNAYARPPPRRRRAAKKKAQALVSSGPDAWGQSMPFVVTNTLRDEGLKSESKYTALQQDLDSKLLNYAPSNKVHGAFLQYDKFIENTYEPRRIRELPITTPTPGPTPIKRPKESKESKALKQSDTIASILNSASGNTVLLHRTPVKTPAPSRAATPQAAPQTPTVDIKFGPKATADEMAAALEEAAGFAPTPPASDPRKVMLAGLKEQLNGPGKVIATMSTLRGLLKLNPKAKKPAIRAALEAALSEDPEQAVSPFVNPTGAGRFATDGMTDIEIMQHMKGMRKYGFQGVIMADEIHLLKPEREMSFIMNLDSSKKNGSHWVAIFISSDIDVTLEYFDSLAQPMTRRFLRDIKHYIIDKLRPPMLLKIKENKVRDQSLNTSTCGLFVMKFLKDRYRGKSFAEASGYSSVPAAEKAVLRFEKHI